MKQCSVEECGRQEQLRRGFCKPHYQRFMKYGDPRTRKVAPENQSLEERIRYIGWTSQPGGCWIWNGDSAKGYGRFTFQGKTRRAHREAYVLWVGDIPEGAMIRHSCDTPLCINPLHLLPGTGKENAQDMMDRGRHNPPQGQRNGRSKLTEIQAQEILNESRKLGPSFDQCLGDKFGVSSLTVRSIRLGLRWTHLEEQ